MGIDNTTTVADVMATPVETTSKQSTISDAASVMHEHDINSLLVPGGEMGIITSTSVLVAAAAGVDPTDCLVEEVMTAPVESVKTNLRMQEVAAMMTNYDISHLPVRDHHGDYVGMISSTDIRELVADPAAGE
jgi:IMP dehydrogenase